MRASRRVAAAVSSASDAARTAATVDLMPPPAAAICSYGWPCARRSNSSTREPAQTVCVWQSTRPGMALMPRPSMTVAPRRARPRAAPPRAVRRPRCGRRATTIAASRWTTAGVAMRREVVDHEVGRLHRPSMPRPEREAPPRRALTCWRERQRADRRLPAVLLVRVLPAARRRRRGAAARDDADAAHARPGLRVGHLRRGRLDPRPDGRPGRAAPRGGRHRGDGALLVRRLDPRGAARGAAADARRRASRRCWRCAATRPATRPSGRPRRAGSPTPADLVDAAARGVRLRGRRRLPSGEASRRRPTRPPTWPTCAARSTRAPSS